MTDYISDDRISDWLDNELAHTNLSPRSAPLLLLKEERRPLGVRKVAVAAALLLLSLGAGGTLVAHSVSSHGVNPAACASDGHAEGNPVTTACASPSASATAEASPSAPST